MIRTRRNLLPGVRPTTRLWVELLEERTVPSISLVSVNAAGSGGGNDGSYLAVYAPWNVSADGRFVVFSSLADDLVANDHNDQSDIFVRDLQTGTATLVSVNQDGTGTGNGGSGEASISADGRYVAFSSSARDLVALPDTNVGGDIFVRDLLAGTTILVSVNLSGSAAGRRSSEGHSMSADGRFVAFQSSASDLTVAGANLSGDIFVRDLLTQSTRLVSVDNKGGPAGECSEAEISADGRFIAFQSRADDIMPGDRNHMADIFVRDLQTSATILASGDRTGIPNGEYHCESPVISADGRVVLFHTRADNLTAIPDGNGQDDLYAHNLGTGSTSLVSVNAAGTAAGNNFTHSPAVSADGRFVAFFSQSTDLVPNDANGRADVFVRDLQTGTTILVSVNRFGTSSGNSSSLNVAISADGRFVAFHSDATDLVSGIDPSRFLGGVFVRDWQTGITTLLSSADGSGYSPVISSDGRVVAYESRDNVYVATAHGSFPAASGQGYAVGAGPGGAPLVRVFHGDGSPRFELTAFDPAFTGGVRTASADVTGDGTPDVIAAAGPGSGPEVRVFDGVSGTRIGSFLAFEAGFTGGVFVAAADFDGDGLTELVVTPDQGGGPRVRVLAGKDFTTVLADFFGIEDPDFRGGARTAVGDLNADGVPDLLVGAGFGGGPRLAAFSGKGLTPTAAPPKLFADFFVFEPGLRDGVYPAAGDLDGDGFAEVMAGGGPGGGPRVFALSGRELMAGGPLQVANFFVGDATARGGVRVVAKDLDDDDRDDLVAGCGDGAGSWVTVYLGRDLTGNEAPPAARTIEAFAGFPGGVFVG